MKLHTTLAALATLPLAVVALGCGAPPDGGSSTGGSSSAAQPAPAGHVHLMLTDQARAAVGVGDSRFTADRASAKTLKYYGGPVVSNVNAIPVYWNASVSNQASITAFYSAVVSGAEMSFLSQYTTTSPKQTIGNGTHGTPFVASQTAKSVTDSGIQSFLTAEFNAGALPKPNNNNYYPVHFPSGVSIDDGSGSLSCVQFCAYHGTYQYNGQDVYYGVLPDLSQSGCNNGCGTSSLINNTTSVASHEFAETVTDPAVGLASSYGPPLGWYNATYGEIGDICNGQQTTATLGDGKSYTVQKLWSNSSGACVTP